jgi:hypothetical protein
MAGTGGQSSSVSDQMARARWQSREEPFGADKSTGTMDPLQHATEAADVHEWEMSLRCARRMSGP